MPSALFRAGETLPAFRSPVYYARKGVEVTGNFSTTETDETTLRNSGLQFLTVRFRLSTAIRDFKLADGDLSYVGDV